MEEKGPRSGCSLVVYKPQRMYKNRGSDENIKLILGTNFKIYMTNKKVNKAHPKILIN